MTAAGSRASVATAMPVAGGVSAGVIYTDVSHLTVTCTVGTAHEEASPVSTCESETKAGFILCSCWLAGAPHPVCLSG